MLVNFDGRTLETLPEALLQMQRALFYGDGLFETVRVFGNRLPFWERHWERLSSGLLLLGFDLPGSWQSDFFLQEIKKITLPNARIRLQIWRAPGGLYLPEDNRPHFLITAQALERDQFSWTAPGLSVGISNRVRLPVDHFSNLKTLNAARYVAAAREAATAGLDDALLLNAHGRICEATSSNVFWWESENLCTVPLSEGCVAGVLRAALLELAQASQIFVCEKPAGGATLATAEEVFLTNAVRGIVPVSRVLAGETRAAQKPAAKTKALFDLLVNQYVREP